MSQLMNDEREFLEWCGQQRLYFKRMRRNGAFVIVACADVARQEELAWVYGMQLYGFSTNRQNFKAMKNLRLESFDQLDMLVQGLSCAVHANSVADFWAAYAAYPADGNEKLEPDEAAFDRLGSIEISRQYCTTPWMNVAYCGPFYGDNTAWWPKWDEVQDAKNLS